MASVFPGDNDNDRGVGGGGSESSPRESPTPDSEFTQHPKFFFSAWKPVWYTGWHTGVLACATSVVVVLFINVGLIIYAVTNPNYRMKRGIWTLYEGSCDKSKTIGLWLHLVINALSTDYCPAVIIRSNVSQHRRGVRLMLHMRGDDGWTLEFLVLGISSGLSLRGRCCGLLLGLLVFRCICCKFILPLPLES